MKKKRWTEKQLKEKIEAIKGNLNSNKRIIKKYQESTRDLEILLKYYENLLQEEHNQPSSRIFGVKE